MKPDTPREFFNSYNERKIRGCYWGLGRPGIGGGAPVFGRLQSEEGKIEMINSVQINLNNIVRDRKGTWKTINLKETSSNANHLQGEKCRDFVDYRLHDCRHILIIWGVQKASNLVNSIDQVQRRKNKRPITLLKVYHYYSCPVRDSITQFLVRRSQITGFLFLCFSLMPNRDY